MRGGIIAVAVATFFGFASPAAAATLVTTTTTSFCSGCGNLSIASLAPFDSSLGALTDVTLQIDGQTQSAFFAYALYPSTTGTADLSFLGPFNATVNGVAYSFGISGDQNVSVTGGAGSGIFTASGTGIFNLDPSLFSSFIDTSNVCNSGQTGVCVSSFQGAPNVPASAGSLIFSNVESRSTATYTLTYVYAPLAAVPEPATWAMMLLGLCGIGVALRRRRSAHKISVQRTGMPSRAAV